jgi:hypothetical protein
MREKVLTASEEGLLAYEFSPSLLLSQNPVGVGHLLVYARLPHGSESGPLGRGLGLLLLPSRTFHRSPNTLHCL